MINPLQIRRTGLEALYQKLGTIGMIQFLQQYESGLGNYTIERYQWLDDLDTKTILGEIEKAIPKGKKKPGTM